MKRALLLLLLVACGSVSGDEKKDAAVAIDSRVVDGAMVDTPVVPFSPSQLPGLVVWLDAEKGVIATATKVNTWTDQSGNGNSAVQLTAARQPTQVPAVINSHGVLRFDGTDDAMQVADAANLNWGTEDFTLAVVASWTNPITSYGVLLSKQLEPYPYYGASIWANFPQPQSSTTFGVQVDAQSGFMQTNAASLNDGTARLLVGRRVGTKLEARIGGTLDNQFDTTTAADITSTGAPLNIGGHPTSTSIIQTLAGDIAEIVVVHGTLSDTDLQKLETYLKTKYAL